MGDSTKKPKSDLKKLEDALGIDLQEDADISIEYGSGKKRELRIRSLGSAAYDIWSANFTLDKKPIDDLSALEDIAGVKLDRSAEVDVSTPPSGEPLRIRSLGSRFYDIWTAADDEKK